MRFFTLAFLLSFSSFAGTWTELKEGMTYNLNQSFQLPQTERSSSLLDYSVGDKFRLKEITPLSSVSVLLFIFQQLNCPGPVMETQMEIIPVQGSKPVVELGIQLQEKCELQVFVENQDIDSKSIFE